MRSERHVKASVIGTGIDGLTHAVALRISDLPFEGACDQVGVPSFCLSRTDLQQAPLAEIGDRPTSPGAPSSPRKPCATTGPADSVSASSTSATEPATGGRP